MRGRNKRREDWKVDGGGGGVVAVEESRDSGVEIPLVTLQEEESFLFGRRSDLAEGVD